MTAFGMRAQIGGILNLLNLRLDVIILGALAGPAPVGVYVVASKLAELLRLPALALTWVSYPQFARRAAMSAAIATPPHRRSLWSARPVRTQAQPTTAAAALTASSAGPPVASHGTERRGSPEPSSGRPRGSGMPQSLPTLSRLLTPRGDHGRRRCRGRIRGHPRPLWR